MARRTAIAGPAARHASPGPATRLTHLLCAAWLAAMAVPPASAQPTPFPPLLERYLAETVKPTPPERQRLARGEPMTRLLETDPGREVAVFGAVWVNASRARYREAVLDIERYERGRAFPVTRKLGTPPQRRDFDALVLPDDTLRDLADCRVGDCKVKLWREAIETVRARVDFASPGARTAAEAAMRDLLFGYVTGYLVHGNARLAEYHDDSPPVRAADEFLALVERWPTLLDGVPELRHWLTGFPQARWTRAVDFLYWQEARFGLKPVLRINHVVIHADETMTVLASKMLYASHYFRAALEVRVLLPDPARGEGYWLVTISRSRPDGLTGLIGRLLRGRVRGEARKGVQEMLASAKRRLERAAAP
jgi:hypothetical protein